MRLFDFDKYLRILKNNALNVMKCKLNDFNRIELLIAQPIIMNGIMNFSMIATYCDIC